MASEGASLAAVPDESGAADVRERGEPALRASGEAELPLSGESELQTSGEADLQAAWQRLQAYFVDDPLAAVTSAVGMVGELTETLVASLQQRERLLRGAWEQIRAGEPADQTERLRVLLREYRDLFNQLTRE